MSEVRFNLGPYSHIVIDIPDTYREEGRTAEVQRDSGDVAEEAMARAEQLKAWFTATPQSEHDDIAAEAAPHEPHRGEDGDPGPQEPARPEFRQPQQPQQRERAPQQEQPRYGAGSGVETREQMLKRSWGNCPDCGYPSKPSIEKYQKWEDTDDGISVPAKHYCGTDACQRKGGTLWRRELVAVQGDALDPDDLPF